MLRSLIAIALLTAQPARAKSIRKVQAELSSCRAAKETALHHLRGIERAPEKYKNVARTKDVLALTIANAEECIKEHQPTVDAHFAAVLRPAAEPKIRPIKRSRPVAAAQAFPLTNTAYALSGAAVAVIGVFSLPYAAPAIFGAAATVSVAAKWSLIVGTAGGVAFGLIRDLQATKSRDAANLQRYDAGNRDDDLMRQGARHGK